MNEHFHNALKRRPDVTPPVWFMRQAGRYHSHYQALRAKHSFMELCKEPELAAKVALGPIEDFDFDVAILFSDLLFPLEALGMGLSYEESGPKLAWSLDAKALSRLKTAEEALPQLAFQAEALKLTRKALPQSKSLIGFLGGPLTLFAYAVEGTHGKNQIRTKSLAGVYESFLGTILPLLSGAIELQLSAGAETVMLFDTSAGELSPQLFKRLVLPPVLSLARRFPGKVGYYALGIQPAHFAGGELEEGLLAGLGVDHRWELLDAFKISTTGFVQGNFDQALLHCDPGLFARLLDEWLVPLAGLPPEQRRGWVCGLGHGVLPGTPEANVRHFIKRVRELCR